MIRRCATVVLMALALSACVSTSSGKRVKHISEAPLDTQVHYWTFDAENAFRKGDLDAGIRAMRQAIKAAGTHGDAGKEDELRLQLARMLIAAGRLDRGADVLAEAVALADAGGRSSAAANALVALADLDLRRGKHASAEDIYRRAAEKYDAAGAAFGAVETRLTLGGRLLASRPAEAREMLGSAFAMTDETARWAGTRVRAALMLAEACFLMRDPAAGRKYLADAEEAAARHPKEAGGYRPTILMAQAKLKANDGDLDAVDRYIADAALTVDDARFPTFNRSGALTRIASQVWSMGYVDAARRIATRAADVVDASVAKQTRPDGSGFGLFGGAAALPFVLLGAIELDNGRLSEARAAYQRALTVLPESDRPGFFSGLIPEEAPSWRLRGIALVGLGRVTIAEGRSQDAVSGLERAVALAAERGDFAMEADAAIALVQARGDAAGARALAGRYMQWAASREATDLDQQAAVLMQLARLLKVEDVGAASLLALRAMAANSAGGSLSVFIEANRLLADALAESDPARAARHSAAADVARKRIEERAGRIVRIAWTSPLETTPIKIPPRAAKS